MQPIIATASLEVRHIDFTSIDMTMELDQPPNMVRVLVFYHHFMKHIMAYMTLNQTAKNVAKLLWQGYILVFRAPAKLLSDWGAKFESNIIKMLCELMAIWKVRTSPYHSQTNGHVEWVHQTLMHMIGKLSKDQKANWPQHLPQLIHAYNSIRLAITGYSSNYLTFRLRPCLPVDFYIPMMRGMKKHWCVNCYVAKLCEWLWEAFKEVQVQSISAAERQKWYYERKANAISLEPGDLVLAKADAHMGKRKVKDWWEEELCEVENQVAEGVPSYLLKNQWTGCLWVLHKTDFFSFLLQRGFPFVWSCELSGPSALPPP